MCYAPSRSVPDLSDSGPTLVRSLAGLLHFEMWVATTLTTNAWEHVFLQKREYSKRTSD